MTIVDARDARVVATVSVSQGDPEVTALAGFFGLVPIRFTRDASRIIIHRFPAVAIFDINRSEPLGMIESKILPLRSVRSPDEKWLYIFSLEGNEAFGREFLKSLWGGSKRKDSSAVVQVLDVRSAKLVATHRVAESWRSMVSDPKTGTVILLSGTESREGPGMLYQFKGSALTRVVEVGSPARVGQQAR